MRKMKRNIFRVDTSLKSYTYPIVKIAIFLFLIIGEMQMGHFFVMSTRFNKCDASDFGLLPLAEDMAISPNDGSIWAKTELYNFGWGDENGYYRYPMPSFEKLFHLVLNSADEEDIYGAASVILKRYPDELLKQCEAIAENRGRSDDFGKLVKVFRLDSPVNRSPVLRKTYAQIQQDSRRWREIADLAKGVKCKSCRLKSST